MILTRAGTGPMTVGEPRTPGAKARSKKTKRMMKDREDMSRAGMGGVSQATIDRVHMLINLEQAAKRKVQTDFSQPMPKPKLWRKRSA